MASLKVDNFLRPFRGMAGESWKEFWDKFAVLAEIQGWDSETKRKISLCSWMAMPS